MRPPQPAGTCQWCGGGIVYPAGHKRAGEPNLRRRWHPECVEAFFIATRSVNQRDACWRRDQGKCAACGVVASRVGWRVVGPAHHWPDTRHQRLGLRPAPYTSIRRDTLHDWDADHIKPLWSAPRDLGLADRDQWFGVGNLQTLCRPCHKAKSAREAAERATVKRPALPLLRCVA